MRRRTRDEAGIALVSAVLVLAVLIMLTAAAAVATVSSRGSASRATQNAQALAAAEAAADEGWETINLVKWDNVVSVTTPCLSLNSLGQFVGDVTTLIAGVGWCPSVATSAPGADSASWRVSQLRLDLGSASGAREVVGTATVGSVTRRVRILLNRGGGSPLFQGFGLISLADLFLGNQTQVVNAGVRSNGHITLQDNPQLCHVSGGAITPGPGHQVKAVNLTLPAAACGGSTTAAPSNAALESVVLPASNDNPSSLSGQDVSYTPPLLTFMPRLVLQNSATLTLTGSTYVFCSIDLKGSSKLTFNPSSGGPVKVYFASPALCAGRLNSDGSQLWLENQSRVANSTTSGAAGLQFLVAGAGTVFLDNTSGPINAVFYAPLGTVKMQNSVEVQGAVAAAAVTMTANSKVTYDSRAATVTQSSGGALYTGTSYGQCSGGALSDGQAPDLGCP